MTYSLQQAIVNQHYITIRALKDAGFDVTIFDRFGQIVARSYYGTLKQAKQCYYRYRRRAETL